jgi:AcrR family transcriptional regulator
MRKTDTGGCPGKGGRPRCPGKQAAILNAALSLLAEQGFTRMTLDRVARAAGVSKATIHLRWKTKAALAAAALAALRPCAEPGPGDPRAALAALLDDFAQSLGRGNGMALIGTCLAEEAHTPQLLRLFREHAVLPRRAALRAVLERARASGELTADADPEVLVSALLGTFYADYLAGRATAPGWGQRTVDAVLVGHAPLDRRQAERHIDHILDGLNAPPANGSRPDRR